MRLGVYNGIMHEATTLGTVGDRVRGLRRGLGLTQEQLGERAGVTGQTVWLLEKGRLKDLKLSTLEGLARALGVSPADLLSATSSPAEYPSGRAAT
jgi:transcriptional regulator with XRE-family HTH domain